MSKSVKDNSHNWETMPLTVQKNRKKNQNQLNQVLKLKIHLFLDKKCTWFLLQYLKNGFIQNSLEGISWKLRLSFSRLHINIFQRKSLGVLTWNLMVNFQQCNSLSHHNRLFNYLSISVLFHFANLKQDFFFQKLLFISNAVLMTVQWYEINQWKRLKIKQWKNIEIKQWKNIEIKQWKKIKIKQ